MSADALFGFCMNLVLPGWLLLVFLPRWKWTARLISSVILPAVLAAIYLYLFLTNWGSAEGGFGTLEDVARLFQNPNILLAGWIHYLAFDLFVGSWEVRDAQRYGIHHLLVIPCLGLTLMFGPVGLLTYFGLRWSIKREFFIDG